MQRPNLISSFVKGSNFVKFWDLSSNDLESTYDQYNFTTVLKDRPIKTIEAQDNVISLAWKPKSQHEKNKFYVYDSSGYIEELEYTEKNCFIVDMSSRGSIAMSARDKKNLNIIPFFEAYINYDKMNKGLYFQERETINSRIHEYSEEGPGFIDIQNQIIHRIKGGYLLDQIEQNFKISQHFKGCQDQYS